MKRVLLVLIFFTFTIIVLMPTMAAAAINAGISLPPPIVFEAPPEAIVMPETSGVCVVADVDTDTPQGSPTGRDEKQEDQTLEKGKTTESDEKSDWKINVWPQPPDIPRTPHERKEENIHRPPDR